MLSELLRKHEKVLEEKKKDLFIFYESKIQKINLIDSLKIA